MMPGTCETCRFWARNETDQDGTGECRRRPPERVPFNAGLGAWPDTTNRDWCGEWRDDSEEA